jgi:hypothetical protein
MRAQAEEPEGRKYSRRTCLLLCGASAGGRLLGAGMTDVASIDRDRVLKAAKRYLAEKPLTVTDYKASRSAGGIHDYYSEGDYWWPDPKNPEGPYIQRDGMSNPGNFVADRHALIRLSVQVPALTAAWKLTHERRFSDAAANHLRAWFLKPDTRMNPDLRYAQAIKGITTGRGTGIIDTIHLVEVARSAAVLDEAPSLTPSERSGIRQWFAEYLAWMNTHKNGIDEREAKNNHGTCWVMQAAEFARFTNNPEMISFCRERYRSVLLPKQMAQDGSFPLELRRTKPYGYSLFNLDAMAGVCQILSNRETDLWSFELPDGRGMRKAMAFMAPYIADKKTWPHPPDVMYFEHWPVRHSSLLFAALAFHNSEYLALWRRLPADSPVEEVIRNWPVRQPVLWTT